MKELDELTTKCIRCGFCLEACPTFRETGDETQSPRGRIYLARSADEGRLSFDEIAPALDSCLGCRACETACPSGVEYGAILELARSRQTQPLARRALLGMVSNGWFLRAQLLAGRVWRPKRIPKLFSPQPPVVRPPRSQPNSWQAPIEPTTIKGEVAVLRGCAMDVLFPRVHQATERLLNRVGYRVNWVSGCCGALHAHQGQAAKGESMAEQILHHHPKLVMNSAGCGAHLRGMAETKLVVDISEFLLTEGLLDLLKASPGLKKNITYHDACHLAHGQGVRTAPRELLGAIPQATLIELPNADHCCGSAGVYNVLQPRMAGQLGEKKLAEIGKIRCDIVAMGNPGCQAWIDQLVEESNTPIRVLHTAELLESSFSGLP
ncbi:MAG: (Fe-S)-binding protein [Chthonomonas sp.]|nr:(Fe-S)-binding protein [Chthonomonas sp.]